MRILLTSISTVEGEAPELEKLAQVLSDIGHQADIFIAPPEALTVGELGYVELKKQLKHTIDLIMPDVIECSGVDVIARALRELGYAYIINVSAQLNDIELVPDIIQQAGFVFVEKESQRNTLSQVHDIDQAKLITMPLSSDSYLVAERLAYYQQMLVRHSLH